MTESCLSRPAIIIKAENFICYEDIAKVDHICEDDLETVCRNIHDKLVSGIEKRLVADAKVGFLLSGGLDSSLVCAVAARKSSQPIHTFAIRMDAQQVLEMLRCGSSFRPGAGKL